MKIESVGDKFNLNSFLETRQKTINATRFLAKNMKPGLSEAEGKKIIDEYLFSIGAEKLWHPSKFRIGTETTKVFRERPNQEIKLQENDIFFIDIGPVFNGHEADYGETFTIGNYDSTISKDSIKIFDEVAKIWRENKISGKDLYNKANQIAESYGYSLADQTGHRLGDFPHAIHFKGHLGDIDHHPCPNLWILEIHLLKNDIGAFFEDILQLT